MSMAQLYRSTEECIRIIDSIKDHMYSSIPEAIRPTREEFNTSFEKRCCTSKLLQIIDQIGETLGAKVQDKILY